MLKKGNKSELITLGALVAITFMVVKGVVETEKLAEATAVSPVDEIGIMMVRNPEILLAG
jgi:hypothetical protein